MQLSTMTSTHPRFPTRLRFLERPAGEGRRADRSVNSFLGLDPFVDPPPFAGAITQANARLYGGRHLPSYTTTGPGWNADAGFRWEARRGQVETPLDKVWKEFVDERRPEEAEQSWETCSRAIREYDSHMVRNWKEEIDTLLVFAGLFSAVTTAFVIESYKWLRQDPTDVSVQLLSQIAGQLGGTPNQIAPQIRGPTNFRPNVWDVAINTLWFSSLVCSLVAALLCILAKQWIREYMRSIPIPFREDISLRQFRYDGLKNWGVKGVITFLPILLEAALALFLIGLVGLLWTLHIIMAAVISVLVVAALLFYLVTLTLPTFSAVDCAFRTPTSWTLRRFRRWGMWRRTTYAVDSHRSWQDLDMDAASKTHKPTTGLLWLAKVSQNRQIFSAVADCVISDSGTDLFTDLEFLEGVMAHTAGCSTDVLHNTVKDLTSLTTLVDRDLEDRAIRDFRKQVSPHRLACLRRVALIRLMRIWNTTIPTMKAPLLDYMLTMLLIFNKSDAEVGDFSAVERNCVETIAFLSSFIRVLFDEAERSALDRISYGWEPTQGQHVRGDQQVLCAKADNLLRHEIRSTLSPHEALQVIPHLVSVARCAYTRMNIMFVDLSTSVFRFLVQNKVREFEDSALREHFTLLVGDMLHFVEAFHETSGSGESGDFALIMRWAITLQHETLAAQFKDEEVVALLNKLVEVLRAVKHMGLFPTEGNVQKTTHNSKAHIQ